MTFKGIDLSPLISALFSQVIVPVLGIAGLWLSAKAAAYFGAKTNKTKAEQAAENGAVPVVALRWSRGPALAVLPLDELLALIAGPDVVRFAPSLIISKADVQEGLARFARALAHVVKR